MEQPLGPSLDDLLRQNLELQAQLDSLKAVASRTAGRLQLIVDGVQDHAISMLDPHGHIETFNAPAERIKGYSRAEVQGQHFSLFFTPEDRAAGLPETELEVARSQGRYEGEGWRLRKDGTRFYAAVSLSSLHDAQGELIGFVKVTQDRTRYRELSEALADQARVDEAMYRVGTALLGEDDSDALFSRLTDEATALCRAQFGAFFYNVTDGADGHYMLYTLSGVPREAFAGFPMPRNTAVFAPTFGGTGVVRSDDITLDPRYGQTAPHHGMPHGHLPVRSYLAVPVVSAAGEVHGGLFFGHAEPGMFTARDERTLVAVAAQASVAVERTRLRGATVEAEAKYRALAESSPQLVWTTTPDGTLEYGNPQFTGFLGAPLTVLQQRGTWAPVMHPDDAAAASAAWAASLASGEPYEFEYRLRRAADGAYRWFLARAVAVRGSDGRITRWVGSSTEIEARRRAEDTQRFLAEAGRLLGSSLDYHATLPLLAHLAAPQLADWCSIDLLDDAGVLQLVAAAHADAGRLAVVHEIRRAYPPDERDAVTEVVRSGQAVQVHELNDDLARAYARDPHHLELIQTLGLRSWMAAPIVVQHRVLGVLSFACGDSGRLFDAQDLEVARELGRRVGVALDNARLFELTQRERLRAEEANRTKDELLSITSHELRTPLNAIVGWSRLLRTGALTPDKQARALETIERNANIQVKLVDDLLDVSRVMTGRLRLDVAPVELVKVVEAALDVVRPAAGSKGVRLQVLVDPDAGLVHGDESRLQQVVWNLVSNAIKFTPKGGRVHLRMQREDSHVEIAVSDTGQGIAPEFLPHVFQPFRQQDASITRAHGGLGLGLAIVKHLVELHGGTITAHSEGLARGASFVVRIPVSPVRMPSAPPGDRPPPPTTATDDSVVGAQRLDGLHILVVDDEHDAVELLRTVLEQCGARVRSAHSVVTALDLLRAELPDIVVSDIGMPDESGYELIRRIRRLPPDAGGRTPAVALTAYASMTDRTRALLEGFTNHCGKPMQPQELVAVVAAAVGRHLGEGGRDN